MTTIAKESYIEILPELLPLFEQHFSETGLYRQFGNRLAPVPDVPRYAAAEAQGILLTLTARHDGELVGYYIGAIHQAPHYANIRAGFTDIPYVRRDFRHRGIGIRLFRAAEHELRARNVALWQASSKLDAGTHLSMDRALRHIGFHPTDLLYYKWLGD